MHLTVYSENKACLFVCVFILQITSKGQINYIDRVTLMVWMQCYKLDRVLHVINKKCNTSLAGSVHLISGL